MRFLPKRWVHTWTGHTKAVSAARLFPKYGHLVLSAGMDNLVKVCSILCRLGTLLSLYQIWDVYNNQKCLRTFMGHQRAVRDVCWSNDGRRFLSCGYPTFLLYILLF